MCYFLRSSVIFTGLVKTNGRLPLEVEPATYFSSFYPLLTQNLQFHKDMTNVSEHIRCEGAIGGLTIAGSPSNLRQRCETAIKTNTEVSGVTMVWLLQPLQLPISHSLSVGVDWVWFLWSIPTCSIKICCCASCSSCSAMFRERSKRPFAADRRMLLSSVISFCRSTWPKMRL